MSVLSRLHHTASAIAIYASRPGSPQDHARLASGCWPDFARRDCLPAGSLRKVSDVPTYHPPLPGLSWRDVNLHPVGDMPRVFAGIQLLGDNYFRAVDWGRIIEMATIFYTKALPYPSVSESLRKSRRQERNKTPNIPVWGFVAHWKGQSLKPHDVAEGRHSSDGRSLGKSHGPILDRLLWSVRISTHP
jgi:hypothetical protein